MSTESDLTPLTIQIPDSIKDYFKIVGLSETGKMKVGYDSQFMAVTKAHYSPFDVIATIKVLKNSDSPIPFYLYLHYETCDANQCMPPRWFALPMFRIKDSVTCRPISLKIAYGVSDSTGPPMGMVSDSTSKFALKKDSSSRMASTGGGSASQPPAGGPPAAVKPAGDTKDVEESSLWGIILLAAGGGLVALMTPCVFPMVPITISFFTKRNAGSKKEARKDALLYACGIILPFVVFGFLMTLIWGKGAIQEFAAHPITNIATALVFTIFSLNLFGLFEIGVPASLLTKLNMTAQKSKSRVFSVVLMGVVFSLTSFTCTVPVVGGLMTAFFKGAIIAPVVGMFVYASVFAAPFVFLALVPSAMKSLPRSGTWMNNVKVVLGFVEIAAAIMYFSKADFASSWHLISRDMLLAAWVAIAILTTTYILGRFRLSHDTPIEHIGAIRVLFAVFFLSVGIYMYTGFNGHPLGMIDGFLPPADYGNEGGPVAASLAPGTTTTGTPVAQTVEQWIPSYSSALAEAKKTGKNIFIDFTGYSCTNCRAMEATVFSRTDVKQIFSNFILARLYTDNGSSLDDSNRDMEENRFNTIALPFYVIVSPDDKPLATFPGFTRDAEDFKNFLNLRRSSSSPSVAMLGQ